MLKTNWKQILKTIFISKTNTYNSYMSMYSDRMIAPSSLFIEDWFIRFLYVCIMIPITDFLLILNPIMTGGPSKSEILFSLYCRNCEKICNSTCWCLYCNFWFFNHEWSCHFFNLNYSKMMKTETKVLLLFWSFSWKIVT